MKYEVITHQDQRDFEKTLEYKANRGYKLICFSCKDSGVFMPSMIVAVYQLEAD